MPPAPEELGRAGRGWQALLCGPAAGLRFLGEPNPVQARGLESWGIVPLTADSADIGEGLRALLARLAEPE